MTTAPAELSYDEIRALQGSVINAYTRPTATGPGRTEVRQDHGIAFSVPPPAGAAWGGVPLAGGVSGTVVIEGQTYYKDAVSAVAQTGIAEAVVESSANMARGVTDAVSGRGSALAKYWLHPVTGWVVPGPHVATDAQRYQRFKRNGFIELPDMFGVENAGSGNIVGRDGTKFLTPFINAGGLWAIDERGAYGRQGQFIMPASQIIEMNLWKLPGLLQTRPDVEVANLNCPFRCLEVGNSRTLRVFTSQALLDHHMELKHQKEMAPDVIARKVQENVGQVAPGLGFDERTMALLGQVLGQALKEALSGGTPEASVAAPEQELAEGSYPAEEPSTNWTLNQLLAYASDIKLPDVDRMKNWGKPRVLTAIQQFEGERETLPTNGIDVESISFESTEADE